MNINDLKNFLNVCESTSISHAAKLMGMSQPTLTESIKRLERDIGASLFYRSKKGVSLTAIGKEARAKAQAILTLSEELTSQGEELKTSYRLGAHSVVAEYFMSELLIEMGAGFQLKIEHGRSQDLQTLIQDGEVDIGVIVNPRKNPDLILKKLCDDRMSLWTTTKTKSSLLLCDPALLQVQTILRGHPELGQNILATESFSLIADLALKGRGIAILPTRYVQKNKLKLSEVKDTKFFKDEFYLVCRPEFGKSSIERKLINSIVEIFA